MFTRGAHRAVCSCRSISRSRLLPPVLVDQVPLVVGDDQRPARLRSPSTRSAGPARPAARWRPPGPPRPRPAPAPARSAPRRRSPRPGLPAPAAGSRRCPRTARSPPPSSISSSTGSRVVPATVVHQHPLLPGQLVQQAGLAHVGAPDQGHPARAAFGAELLRRGASGSAASTASSRSPLPRPCSALTGTGSPRPSDHSAAAAGSASVSSPCSRPPRPVSRTGAAPRPPRRRHLSPHHRVHHEQHRIGGVHRDPRLCGDQLG